MTVFDGLNLIGGLCLFLYGMSAMSSALERRAGAGLKALIGRMTAGKATGILTGLAVTAVIQSSSAATVMVVGFVNSGMMSLKQAINVIMGSNIGTTVTAWILSLSGISSDNFFVQLLKPTSFTPILAFIGIILLMTGKTENRKLTGTILLDFAVLMFGMNQMSSAVSGLAEVPAFKELFVAFTNPFLGLLAGAVLTAIIQSSSASVGILQALAATGVVTYGVAIPIIMGQNIGTCVTALLSCLGANKDAKRAAMVHLGFNLGGALFWLTVFIAFKAAFAPALLSAPATLPGIAVIHSAFNILCTVIMLPLSGILEKAVCLLVRNDVSQASAGKTDAELDERLLSSPALALSGCRALLKQMADKAVFAANASMEAVREGAGIVVPQGEADKEYRTNSEEKILSAEEETDHIQDVLGTYLIKLAGQPLNENESAEATEYIVLVGEYERIADLGLNLLAAAREIKKSDISFSPEAKEEFARISSAVTSILDLSYAAFTRDDLAAAKDTEPLEKVIDSLKDKLRYRHIKRLQKGNCSIQAGFVFSDILMYLERISDHCSNISACVTGAVEHNLNTHENLHRLRRFDEDFWQAYKKYTAIYDVN